ncbi:MAG TPA: 16S rRNA (guanine(966)-N(2))-methyltransferase RsmD [Pyrinomonadaceae bacterium]|jgi:16S rRNA (guanine(966)-N(2))-methyltransferase RsmD
MENRRQTTNTPNTFNRNKNFRKEGEKSFGYGKYQNRDRKFQPRGENKFQKPDGFQPRDGRFVKRGDSKFFPKTDKFQPKRNFPQKGKKFQPWNKENNIRIVSDMQVTDGKHKGKYLQNTDSPKVRPTARRIREVAFKILYRRIRAKRFLDLCAGSGTVGIEAISRGAIISTFVERSARMCSFIKKNLEVCGIKEGHGEVCEMEVAPFLKKMWKRRRFWDVVYFDPPYNENYDEALKYFSRGATVTPGGVLVIEHHSEMFFPEKIGVMKRFRVVVQGETTLSFYERKA